MTDCCSNEESIQASNLTGEAEVPAGAMIVTLVTSSACA